MVENVRAPYVSKYSMEGFKIRENRVIGSIALLPTALLHWTVSHHSTSKDKGAARVLCGHVAVLYSCIGAGMGCVWFVLYKLLLR